jgi:hypothetical protein
MSCAHVKPDIKPVKQLQMGIRATEVSLGVTGELSADRECKQPPKIYEGVAKRFDETCMFVDEGPASCTYMGNVPFGRSWACGMALMQDNCKGEWLPHEMNCVPWDERYQALVPSWEDQRK